MEKILFTFNIDNAIDIITNSSSELFILEEETQELALEMVKEAYPEYLSEYEPLVALRDANSSQISTYLSWVSDSWYDNYRESRHLSEEERIKADMRKAIMKAEKYGMTPETFYTNWDKRTDGKWWYGNISEEGLRNAAKTLDPDGKIFLLFSIDENPNWEAQESLEAICQRYHLG